ncbi:MAG: CDP-alcohol phosphatidyltransferase family protein [candidate division KSB1 bacterium]|nr:CDP-alcohol phosphatidyltransferase family protein [candidate division KSB1 bacterium]MDZ7346050.1 CDP-alcohol phosphatidyltransferase family protein [candidate division KSB1 bacterium]
MSYIEKKITQFLLAARPILQPVVRFLAALQMNPNLLTFISLLLCLIAAFFFAQGELRFAAVAMLLGGLFDVLDGDVARAANRTTRFGALFDSVLDRYAELALYFGIGYFFLTNWAFDLRYKTFVFFVVFMAAAGSTMVSYVRARAEGLDIDCRVGLMQRPERILLLGFGALISVKSLLVVLALIALLANFTAVQRIVHVWKIDKLNDN